MNKLGPAIVFFSFIGGAAAFAQSTPAQQNAYQAESDERQVHHDGIRNRGINRQMGADGRQISRDRQIEAQDLRNGNVAAADQEKRQIAHDRLQVHDDRSRIKHDKQQIHDDRRQIHQDKSKIRPG